MTGPSNEENEQRLTDVFLKYRRILGNMVGRIVKPHDIEDIVQETFVRAYENRLKHEINHPKTYLYNTARNLALNHISKKSYSEEQTVGDFELSDVIEGTETLESQMQSKEKFQFFCRAVRDLPAQCRRAFILKRVYGLSQKEIASYMKISERTVEGHIAKGAVRCAQYLKEHGYRVGTNAQSTKRKVEKKQND